MSEEEKQKLGLPSIYDKKPELPSPPNQPALPSPAPAKKELPAPAGGLASGTAIQKAFSPDATGLALPDADALGAGGGDGLRLSLPPAVEARLRSLVDRHSGVAGAGKPLTAAERAEAQGLLDIAEYFVVQRLRNRLAA